MVLYALYAALASEFQYFFVIFLISKIWQKKCGTQVPQKSISLLLDIKFE
jgi:hypothetical protein